MYIYIYIYTPNPTLLPGPKEDEETRNQNPGREARILIPSFRGPILRLMAAPSSSGPPSSTSAPLSSFY